MQHLKSMSASLIYYAARQRWHYGRNPSELEGRLSNHWFVDRIHRHFGGGKPQWMHPHGWGFPAGQERILRRAQDFMREFCGLTDSEVEDILVSKSVADTAKYSIKIKHARLEPEAEKKFMDLCKGRKSRFNSMLSYCGCWDIMPDNMTEITMIAGFEGGRRGKIGTEFMKKLADNKRRCRELLAQIMKMDGIGEDEPIARIMERLGA